MGVSSTIAGTRLTCTDPIFRHQQIDIGGVALRLGLIDPIEEGHGLPE